MYSHIEAIKQWVMATQPTVSINSWTLKWLGHFFKTLFYSLMMFTLNVTPCMKLSQYTDYLICTVVTDGLVLQHQGKSSHSVEYALMCFLVCKS